MKPTRTWIVIAIAVLAVLALSTGIVLASQQHSNRMGDNATQLCEQMHGSMHDGDVDMDAMHDGMHEGAMGGMGGMGGIHGGGMGGMHDGSTAP